MFGGSANGELAQGFFWLMIVAGVIMGLLVVVPYVLAWVISGFMVGRGSERRVLRWWSVAVGGTFGMVWAFAAVALWLFWREMLFGGNLTVLAGFLLLAGVGAYFTLRFVVGRIARRV